MKLFKSALSALLLLGLTGALAAVYAQTPAVGPGIVFTDTNNARATGAGTTVQTPVSYTLPAGVFSQPGRKVRVSAGFKTAANGNNKTVQLFFGAGASSGNVSTGAVAANNGSGVITMIVTETATATTQQISGYSILGTTATAANTTASLTTSAAIPVWVGATDGSNSAGDITITDFTVELLN